MSAGSSVRCGHSSPHPHSTTGTTARSAKRSIATLPSIPPCGTGCSGPTIFRIGGLPPTAFTGSATYRPGGSPSSCIHSAGGGTGGPADAAPGARCEAGDGINPQLPTSNFQLPTTLTYLTPKPPQASRQICVGNRELGGCQRLGV